MVQQCTNAQVGVVQDVLIVVYSGAVKGQGVQTAICGALTLCTTSVLTEVQLRGRESPDSNLLCSNFVCNFFVNSGPV